MWYFFWHFCILWSLAALVLIYCDCMEKSNLQTLQNIFFLFHRRKSVTQVWNNVYAYFLHKLILSSPVLDNIKDKLGESWTDCLWRLYLFNRRPELYHFWTSSWNMHQQTISWTVQEIKFSPMRRVSTCLFVLRPTVPCDPEKRWKILAPAVQPIISFIW